nr:MAG TPA: hypothetical protein [Caudoviricetes sp.]
MTDKELNSHDLTREIEIVKLQEENERLNGAIQTYNILLKSNIKENEELKSQLRGTTHCFDEEEHKKLKEEITNLSKDVDMWNAKYNDMFDENRMLKKHLKVPKACNLKTLEDYKSYYEDTTREQILEDTYIEYCAYVNLAHRYSELEKQLEDCYCNRTDCSGRIKDSKVYDSLVQKVETQQREFINYLESWKENEEYCYLASNPIDRCRKDIYKEVLQKYKEIIGVSDENNKQ